MRLADAGGGPDLEVRFDPGRGVTAGELAAALPTGHPPLVVDGVAVEDTRPLPDAGLAHGATVGGPPGPATAELVVVAGPLAPVLVPLDGPVLVGRGRACGLRLDHPSVAAAHVLVEPRDGVWAVCTLGSEPAELDGEPIGPPRPLRPGMVLTIGAVDLEVVDRAPPPLVGGLTAPARRPRRRVAPSLPDLEPPPDAPAEPAPPAPPGGLSLLLPVAVGGVVAVTFHPTAGLITALTPLLALGAHLDARRRHRRDLRRARAEHAAAVEDHHEQVEARSRQTAAVERAAFPTPGQALASATTGHLWATGDVGPDLEVAVGWTDDGRRAPVVARIGADQGLGLVGPRDWAEAVARAVVVQLTARVGPDHLHVALDPTGPWTFTRWLPHRGGSGPTLAAAAEDANTTIEVAEHASGLSDRCATVMTWTPSGAQFADPAERDQPIRPVLAGPALAERYGRAAARWSSDVTGAALPERLSLTQLVARPHWPPERTGRKALVAPLGRTTTGPLEVDLVAHGPHALVAGTTGAGKSELLRTWVTALALRHPPSAVAFVLVDYKGGSAFDACARLPHVTGVVTDLDAGLGERLLVALRAEVHDRERRLRAAAVGDLRDLEGGPPRLVVVVDEFATLAAELPDVLAALVDVARRGRSLGLHLVLATQRPAGVVSDDIRANTALRVCLRTLDPADSQDVLGDPDAAGLPGDRPGRAWLRLDGEPVLAQIASTGERTVDRGAPLLVRAVGEPWPVADAGPVDLDHLVTAAITAWGSRPGPPPTWLPPLPEAAPAPEPRAGPGVPLGREDRPAARSQPDLVWDPDDGHLVVFGRRGAGCTTTALTAVLGLAATRSPADLHLHLVSDRGDLTPLSDLPHTGTLLPPSDHPGLRRLLGRLLRGHGEARSRRTVVVVDGYDALTGDLDDLEVLCLLEDLERVAREGPANGISLLVTSRRPVRLPPSLLATAAVGIALSLHDPGDLGLLGLTPPTTNDPPGRGLTLAGHTVQVFLPPPATEAVAAIAARHGPAPPGSAPLVVGPLPDRADRAGLGAVAGQATVGLRDRDLLAARVVLPGGLPFVITGPPRSGRSHALDLLLAQAPVGPRTVYRREGDPAAFLAEVTAWLAAPCPHLFAVDDAETLDDPDGVVEALATRRHPDAVLLVAVRADAWRAGYGSWLSALRPADRGLVLAPDPARDGDGWLVALPRVPPVAPPGRGVLVDSGSAEVIQVADG